MRLGNQPDELGISSQFTEPLRTMNGSGYGGGGKQVQVLRLADPAKQNVHRWSYNKKWRANKRVPSIVSLHAWVVITHDGHMLLLGVGLEFLLRRRNWLTATAAQRLRKPQALVDFNDRYGNITTNNMAQGTGHPIYCLEYLEGTMSSSTTRQQTYHSWCYSSNRKSKIATRWLHIGRSRLKSLIWCLM